MVYLVGSCADIKEGGVVVNAGEGRRCNVYIGCTPSTERPAQLKVGQRVKVMADVNWAKRDDGTFTLKFTAVKIETK